MIGEILDLIWPRTCEVCGRPADRPGRHLCCDCHMRLPLVPTDGLCRRCGRDAVGLDGEYLCEDCRRYRPAFDRAASALRFEGEARELINAYKFRDRLNLRDDFVDLLEAVVRVRFLVDHVACVVPMPSTVGHRLTRGYNPSAILAAALAKRLALPCRNLLRRKGHPRKQGGLDESSRRTNVLGTFAVSRSFPLCGQTSLAGWGTVLLVDDIMTTGSTLAEAAHTLKSAGVKTVWCVTLARSVRL